MLNICFLTPNAPPPPSQPHPERKRFWPWRCHESVCSGGGPVARWRQTSQWRRQWEKFLDRQAGSDKRKEPSTERAKYPESMLIKVTVEFKTPSQNPSWLPQSSAPSPLELPPPCPRAGWRSSLPNALQHLPNGPLAEWAGQSRYVPLTGRRQHSTLGLR